MKVRIVENPAGELNAHGDILHTVFVESLDGTILAKYQPEQRVITAKKRFDPETGEATETRVEETINGWQAAERACKTNKWQIVNPRQSAPAATATKPAAKKAAKK